MSFFGFDSKEIRNPDNCEPCIVEGIFSAIKQNNEITMANIVLLIEKYSDTPYHSPHDTTFVARTDLQQTYGNHTLLDENGQGKDNPEPDSDYARRYDEAVRLVKIFKNLNL